jgi:hypothetical protein
VRRVLAVLIGVALLTVARPTVVVGADIPVTGRSLTIKDPRPGVDPSRRSIAVFGGYPSPTGPVVGDPIADGVTVHVYANGANASEQTFHLPPGAYSGGVGWIVRGAGGFTVTYKYKDGRGLNGPVKKARIARRSGHNSELRVDFVAKGTLGPGPQPRITVVPPAPGTEGGMRFAINGGTSYCVSFSGSARIADNRSTVFKMVDDNNHLDPCPAPTTTTTTTLP